MNNFFNQFFCEYNNSFSLVIEDDGYVAYAYLLKDEDLIGDVWLYNRSSNPDYVDWKNIDDMPFLNPKEYLKNDELFIPLTDVNEIVLRWDIKENNLVKVIIFIRSKPIAFLKPFSKPGWSFLVKKSGPVANFFENWENLNL